MITEEIKKFIEGCIDSNNKMENARDINLDLFLSVGLEALKGSKMAFFEIETGYPKNLYGDKKANIDRPNPVLPNWEGRYPVNVWIKKPFVVIVQNKNGQDIFQQDYE